jgi:hypothetical protein
MTQIVQLGKVLIAAMVAAWVGGFTTPAAAVDTDNDGGGDGIARRPGTVVPEQGVSPPVSAGGNRDTLPGSRPAPCHARRCSVKGELTNRVKSAQTHAGSVTVAKAMDGLFGHPAID